MTSRGPILLLLIAIAAFAAGLWRLFDLRFAAGDVYPPGSTLRADPDGTRAYFESLGLLPGRTASRLLLPLSSVHGGPGVTLFLLAVDSTEAGFGARDREALNNLLANGTRIVVTLAPSAPGTNGTRPLTAVTSSSRSDSQTIAQALDLPLLAQPSDSRPSGSVAQRATAAAASLPVKIPWRGASFKEASEPWSVLYTLDEAPVVLERKSGRGTLVVLAGNDLLTNDGLRHHRQPALLAWLAGRGSQLLFDETHLGTRLKPGMMTLVRRYHLSGVLLGLLAVAALALWRSVAGLAPHQPGPDAHARDVVTGRDSAASFTNLLRRSIPAPELLPLCLAEWRRSLPRNRPDLQRKAAALQDLVNLESARPIRQQDPARTYRALSELLSRP